MHKFSLASIKIKIFKPAETAGEVDDAAYGQQIGG